VAIDAGERDPAWRASVLDFGTDLEPCPRAQLHGPRRELIALANGVEPESSSSSLTGRPALCAVLSYTRSICRTLANSSGVRERPGWWTNTEARFVLRLVLRNDIDVNAGRYRA
jgi:hypothetical protein